ncbi:hypothetical protein AB3S75_027417 [Citrus x aurantiifolia]
MAGEKVLAPVPAAALNLKRKLDDLEPGEALEHAEGMRDDEAKSGNGFAVADGSEAKQPKLNDDKTERPDGPVNANGLKEEKPDEVVDAEQPTEDTTKEEEKETVEVKTEQHSSVEEQVLVDYQQISVKEETKEVLIGIEEASIDVEEETKEVTVKEEETVKEGESVIVDPQQSVENSKSDDPSSTDDSTISRKIVVPNDKVGVLIGKAGDTIRYLQYNSGAKIQITRYVDADPHAATRPVEIIGTLSNIDKAEKLINAIIAEADAGGSPSLVARGVATAQASGAAEQVEIKVLNEKVGLIIGRGGETIKGLQTRAGARIQLIPQHLLEEDGSKERIVRVTGDMGQIEIAQQMIKEVLCKTVRLSPCSNGFNQPAYQPRGPTSPQTGVIFICQLLSDINVMKDAIVHLCQNDICCQVPEFSTKEQLIKKLSCSGRNVIIASDHTAGNFLGKIALYTSGVVIGVPMRASAVKGVQASFLGFSMSPTEGTGVSASMMSREVPIVLVGTNDAMEAARLAMSIFAFGDPEARILKKM